MGYIFNAWLRMKNIFLLRNQKTSIGSYQYIKFIHKIQTWSSKQKVWGKLFIYNCHILLKINQSNSIPHWPLFARVSNKYARTFSSLLYQTSVCYDWNLLGASPQTFSLYFQCQSLVIFIHHMSQPSNVIVFKKKTKNGSFRKALSCIQGKHGFRQFIKHPEHSIDPG